MTESKAGNTRTLVTARKLGGSLMVTIPREIVERENLAAGELVELEVRKAKKSFFGATPGVGPFTSADKLGDHE